MDKKIIEKAFSKIAHLYDKFSSVQKVCAHRLLEEISPQEVERILEVGCGTGNYTRLLRERFPSARIRAVDLSEEMVKIAGKKLRNSNIEFIVGDSEKIPLGDNFNLITSNATFQWLDLNIFIRKCRTLLDKNGRLHFSTFGPLTFRELRSILDNLFFLDKPLPVESFLSKKEIESILRANFKKVHIKEYTLIKKYPSLWDFLLTVKYTSPLANGKKILTRKMLNILEKIYLKKFSEIRSTYQVFFVSAYG